MTLGTILIQFITVTFHIYMYLGSEISYETRVETMEDTALRQLIKIQCPVGTHTHSQLASHTSHFMTSATHTQVHSRPFTGLGPAIPTNNR